MDASVIAAYISGVFAIFGPIIVFIATKHYEIRYLQPINHDRRIAVVGRCRGEIVQPNLTSNIELRFDVRNKEVIGEAQINRVVEGRERLITLTMTGGFLYDRFLKLDYKNADASTIQFGSITLELAADPRAMEGKYSGYGSVSNCIVFGEIHLTKVEA
ncbi:hypothetical protein [Methylomonas sp. YC3]